MVVEEGEGEEGRGGGREGGCERVEGKGEGRRGGEGKGKGVCSSAVTEHISTTGSSTQLHEVSEGSKTASTEFGSNTLSSEL